MTALEAAKRNEKAQWLNTWQVDETSFYVESEDGKIAYRCSVGGNGDFCQCGDFAQKSKTDPNFKCKHLLAVMNSVPRDQVLEAHFLEKRKPKLDERFIKTIDGKDFCLYQGLLDLAHQKNLCRLEVEIIQYPSKDNEHTAICKAVATTTNGGTFTDIGDANPMNTNAKVGKHICRMASTRAKARCLRDLTNIGMTCLEELGDISEVITGDEDQKPGQPRKEKVIRFPEKQAKAPKETKTAPETDGKEITAETQGKPTIKNPVAETIPPQEKKPAKSGNGNGKQAPKMSEAQKNAIFNLSRRRGISVEELDKLSMKTFNVPMETLNSTEASSFTRTLQQSA